jgi:acyl transferase domain-containing protein
LPLISNVSGELVGDDIRTAAYWRRHLREPVRYAQGIKTLLRRGIDTFVEVGPHPVLLGMTAPSLPASALGVASMREGHPDLDVMLRSVAELYVHGVAFDWKGFDRAYARRRVSLPTYAWQRAKHWNADPSAQAVGRPVESGILGRRIPTPVALQLFEGTVDDQSSGVEQGVVSATHLLSMATEAIRNVIPDGPIRLDRISIPD